QNGNTIQPQGQQVIGGATCTGYSVKPSEQAILAAIKKASQSGSTSAALQAMGAMLQPTVTVWFNGQGLLCRLSAHLGMQFQVGSSNDSVATDVALNFANYGAPVQITPPPPSEIVSASSILNGLTGGS